MSAPHVCLQDARHPTTRLHCTTCGSDYETRYVDGAVQWSCPSEHGIGVYVGLVCAACGRLFALRNDGDEVVGNTTPPDEASDDEASEAPTSPVPERDHTRDKPLGDSMDTSDNPDDFGSDAEIPDERKQARNRQRIDAG